ncbi:MAG TPA: tyrosine--tRNA ligase [Fibrobacteraceae bacterium]|nr:tyrosine--tRNA ligase [Fibrobacteraceae bacterium]
MTATLQEQLDALMRGVVEIVPQNELKAKLKKALETGKPLRIKLGVDPTAPDVHLGFTVVMRKLAQFQQFGHQVVLIVGDYTATVGDPSGRSKARPRLSHEQVLENARHYQEQFFKIVDRSRTEIVYNGEWFKSMTFDQVTKLLSQITVAQMLEREDFQNRYSSGNPISLHEFMYPLMQGYDSLMIRSDVEIGGTDQKFNVLRGREIQLAEGQEPQIGLFMPILIGTDGKTKMSKSVGNYIGINEPADVMYHKVYTIPDTLIADWFTLLTNVSPVEITQMAADIQTGKLNPNEAKHRLALDIVTQYHGATAATQAAERERSVHSGHAIPGDAIEKMVVAGSYPALDFLVQIGAFASKGEARRMIQNGGVKLNGEKLTDPAMSIAVEAGGRLVLQVGKRSFYKVGAIPTLP